MQCANLGGMEQASLRLMQALGHRGHQFSVLSLNPIAGLGPLLEESGIPAEGMEYAGRGGWRSWLPLRRRLKSISADALVMTGHNLMAQFALGDFCQGRRVLAIHFHHEGVMPDWQWGVVYRKACLQFRSITFPSDFIRKEAERIYPPVAEIARTLRNPMVVPAMASAEQKLAARQALKLPLDAQIIGNAGWLIPRKRFDVFLRVAAKVMAANPKAQAVIAGDGEERAALEKLAAELGISQRVTWTGWLKKMDAFYHSVDVLLFNSDWDALPTTPQEAMGRGIPVVASALHGGLAEVMSSRDWGYMLPQHDVDALAAEILRLLRDPADSERRALAGRERIRELADPKRIAEEFESLFRGDRQSRKSVAVMFHRLGPYHFSRLQAAGRIIPASAIELSGADESYAWDPVKGSDGFQRITLFEQADSHSRPVQEVITAVKSALEKCEPAVVAINGWSDPGALSALQWCVKSKIPAIMMSESTASDGRRLPWGEWVKGRLVRLCSSGLVGGTPHVEYLAMLGMARDRIFMGYDVVDNSYFTSGAAKARAEAVEARRRYNLPERFFMASARFIDKKNLPGLIKAYVRYRALAKAKDARTALWDLVLLGDGPLKRSIEEQITGLGIRESVRLPGFAQYPDLPAYYGLASVFIHASTTEQWGLVVNEAMASSLPVLVSNRCGCAADLVVEGANGYTFNPFDLESLAQLMLKCTESEEKLAAMGQASSRIIAEWGPNRFADYLGRAVTTATDAPLPAPTWVDHALLRVLLLAWRG
jgi:glycosyltransferase involved in cell wall biosynthesis